MEDKIRILLSEEEVNARISEVAAQINADYAGTYFLPVNWQNA